MTEDITGAIADSINYAIEALRELVATINDSAISLDAAAKQTQGSARPAGESVGGAIEAGRARVRIDGRMAASIEEVSGNAERSSDVARHSVDVAHKGGDAVRRTIDGMNTIRETIQDTSKRIKRLGESSQEIGNIVELINDIAEQTNILALNASIQASMAGEAGRGFAVVADEVQRLAERAANATKQIEVLVRTIQADTNEAVVSMERSTTDVVGGALLAENAGAALEEIEQVSNQIASLVQNISASSRQQASAAQNIARNMHVLREISSQTAENSAATSERDRQARRAVVAAAQIRLGLPLPDAVSGGSALLTDPARKAPPASPPSLPTAAPAAAPAREPHGCAEESQRPQRIEHRSRTMAEVSSQTLHIVARELASELNEARASLEAFGEQQDNLALLRKARAPALGARRAARRRGLRRGAARRGNGPGRALPDRQLRRETTSRQGLDALMRAMVQLPTYLERVMSGGRDMALVLLPLLNDLRAVRGQALLSEGTLLLLNLSSDQQANPRRGVRAKAR